MWPPGRGGGWGVGGGRGVDRRQHRTWVPLRAGQTCRARSRLTLQRLRHPGVAAARPPHPPPRAWEGRLQTGLRGREAVRGQGQVTHTPQQPVGGGFRGARTWHAGLCVPSQTTSLVLQASETARAPSVSLAGGGDLEPLAGWTVVLGSRPCSSGGSGFGKITKVAQGPPAASPRSPGAGSSVMSPETRTVSTPSFCRAGSPFPVRSQLRLSDEGTPSTGWGRRLGLRVKVPARGCLMERDKGYGPLTGYKLSQND